MTETGWIIVILVAVAAIIVAILVLRRKGPAGPLAASPVAADILPEQVALPVEEPSPAPVVQAIAPVAAPVEPVPVEPILVSTPPIPATAAIFEGEGDNLLRLKGVGPKIAAVLKANGITRYAQIAVWSDADIAAIDAKLGSFAGRPKRDNWVDQARLLAAGDVAGYEATYGKL